MLAAQAEIAEAREHYQRIDEGMARPCCDLGAPSKRNAIQHPIRMQRPLDRARKPCVGGIVACAYAWRHLNSATIGFKNSVQEFGQGVMILQKGQKVRLTERGLKFHMSVSGPLAPRQNWDRRTGTVKRLTRSKTHAVIAWDGNASLADAMPVTFFQPT
jgi:hypothetical protein